MSDNKSKRGNPDRRLVSAKEDYEVAYLARKTELPKVLVRKIIEQEGPSRVKVENYLMTMRRNGR